MKGRFTYVVSLHRNYVKPINLKSLIGLSAFMQLTEFPTLIIKYFQILMFLNIYNRELYRINDIVIASQVVIFQWILGMGNVLDSQNKTLP